MYGTYGGQNGDSPFLSIDGALKLINFRDRKIKEARLEEPFASIVDEIRRHRTGRDYWQDRQDIEKETEEEDEESRERHRAETAIFHKAWESVSHNTIMDYFTELAASNLWPYERTGSMVSGPSIEDEIEDEQQKTSREQETRDFELEAYHDEKDMVAKKLREKKARKSARRKARKAQKSAKKKMVKKGPDKPKRKR